MSASAFKRLWPALVAPRTRTWVMERVDGGIIDRANIALGVPLDAIGRPDTPLPDGAVRIGITASSAIQAVAGLPRARCRFHITVTGRTVKLRMKRGIVATHGKESASRCAMACSISLTTRRSSLMR